MVNSVEIERRLAVLKKKVAVFRDEVETLVAFHEVWRPTAYDAALHGRMGVSVATHTFGIIRLALRREVLLGLVRLWDNPKQKAVSLENIGNILEDGRVVEALVMDSVEYWGKVRHSSSDEADPDHAEVGEAVEFISPEARAQSRAWVKKTMAASLQRPIDDALTIIAKYSEGGSGYETRKHLNWLRDKKLAHRQVEVAAPTGPDRTDGEIEAFYQDMLALMQLLTHAVDKAAYNPQETVETRQRHSKLFWNGVRGERTEGHPDYRIPSALS